MKPISPGRGSGRVRLNHIMVVFRLRWDADQFSDADVLNLLARAGMQVGIGEGRPDSPNSNGLGNGCWEVGR